jgi:hypothetical protein
MNRLDIEYIGWRQGATMDVRWVTPEAMALFGGARNWLQQNDNVGGPNTSQPNMTQPSATITLEGLAPDAGSAFAPVPSKAMVGLDDLGRWIVFAFSWKGQASRARLVKWQVEAVFEGRQREAY